MPPRPPARRAPHFILGEDSYRRQELREEIIRSLVPEEARAFAVREFSLARAELAEVLRAATTPTLLSPRQVLVLTDVERLGEDEVEQLEELLDAAPEFTVLLFEEAKLDKRTRAWKLLEERCQLHPADSPQGAAAEREVERLAREFALKLTRERAQELIFVVGTDVGQLRGELEKLRAFVGSERKVTVDDLAAVVTAARQFKVFDLIDLLAERRRADALVLLRLLLAQGESPIGIVGLLAWLYRQLRIAQVLPPGTPAWKTRGLLRAPASRVEQLLRQARKFDPEQLQEAFVALTEADDRLKSSPPDPQAVVEMLVVRLTQPAPARAATTAP